MKGAWLRLIGSGLLVVFLQACGGTEPGGAEADHAVDASGDATNDPRGDERTHSASDRDGPGNALDASRDTADALAQGDSASEGNPPLDGTGGSDASDATSDASVQPDATADDADAPPTDTSTRGAARVTVLDPGGAGVPAVGATVVFFDPDGTMTKRTVTDSDGHASADVLPGAHVTAIEGIASAQTTLQTVFGIVPGDDVVLGSKNADTSNVGSFTITFPAYASAASYVVSHPCGNALVQANQQLSATVSMIANCKLDTMEILVTAQDVSGVPLASISKAQVPFVAGGTVALTGIYTAPRTFTASYTGIDPVVTALGTTRSAPDAFGLSTSSSVATNGATLSVPLVGPATTTTADVVTQVANAAHSTQLVRQGLAGSAASYGLDVHGTLLPWIAEPTLDPATGTITVPLDTTGTTSDKPDLFQTTLSYRRTDDASTTVFGWTLFGGDATDIVLPHLPAELADLLPVASDTSVVKATMVEADSVAGYDAVRNNAAAAFTQLSGNRPSATVVRVSRSPLVH